MVASGRWTLPSPWFVRGARGAAVLVLGVACAQPATTAEPTGLEVVRHSASYTVDPTTAAGLQHTISEQWQCAGGQCTFGLTQTRVSYRYVTAPTESGLCVIQAHVNVETTVTLPHWEAPAGTSSAMRQWWAQIAGEVTQHEYEHRRISEDGAAKLLAALTAIPPTECRDVGAKIAATADAVLEDTKSRQTDLDQARGVVSIPPRPPE